MDDDSNQTAAARYDANQQHLTDAVLVATQALADAVASVASAEAKQRAAVLVARRGGVQQKALAAIVGHGREYVRQMERIAELEETAKH